MAGEIVFIANREESPREESPEIGLWSSVLQLAIDDIRGKSAFTGNDRAAGRAYYRRRAIGWFNSSRQNEGSFLWVCGVLNLDARAVRQRVLSDAAEPRRRHYVTNTHRAAQAAQVFGADNQCAFVIESPR